MKILVLNVGSSTCKTALFDITSPTHSQLVWEQKHKFSSLKDLLITKIPNPAEVKGAGHRVVHGGEYYHQPTLITPTVKKAIRGLSSLAPLHNEENLSGIEELQNFLPSIPQIAVFDTAFHATLPPDAATYALPVKLREFGIRRYGFHGISHEYCSKKAAFLLDKNIRDLKIVTCHLGSGCSLAAISGGQSIDTTMGFTPMDGVMMGTRCGSLDPGALLYLLKKKKLTVDTLDHLLNYESGLKGICGFSDMQEVMQLRQENDPNACLAFDMLSHSIAKNLGSMICVLGGLDVIVFAGGIGENCPELRESVCQKISYLGAFIDREKNYQLRKDSIISSLKSKAKILVIHTKEEEAIALACFKLINLNHKHLHSL